MKIRSISISRFSALALAAALAVGALALHTLAAETPVDPAAAVTAAQAKLHGKQFRSVTVSMDNGIVTLAGSVDLYAAKADAERRVHKAQGVQTVRNHIAVAGPAIADQVLEAKLQKKLAYDRVGYGNMFNAIGVQVANGVAYLTGHARTDVDKDSALAEVSYTPGVKDVVDAIAVDPVSMMDDRTRFAVARAVYGFPSLNKYAIDPAKPIRISVQNGNVELFGMVNSESDKNLANIEANTVPGVFSVKNFLQVEGQHPERN